jgi:AraC-like DNA-binding protein
MNGFDLCRKIKENPELSHIPIILLTSRTDPINQKLGYKIGADAYMAKPFDLRIMYKLICSQLKNRQEIKKLYAGSFFTSLTENINYTPADEQFIIKLNNIIKENLDNSDLDAQFLVDKLCISRTSLFNKMNSLLGVPVAKYIRRMRIEAAKNLLVNTDKQINNVALCTGFAESQYFSTVFKQETGMTPTQYKQEHAKKRRIENKVNP